MRLLSLSLVIYFSLICINPSIGQIKVNYLQDIFFKDTSLFVKGSVNLKGYRTIDQTSIGISVDAGIIDYASVKLSRSYLNLINSPAGTSPYYPLYLGVPPNQYINPNARTRKFFENNIRSNPNFLMTGYSNEFEETLHQTQPADPNSIFLGFNNRVSGSYSTIECFKNDVQGNIQSPFVSGLSNYFYKNPSSGNFYGSNSVFTLNSSGAVDNSVVYGYKALLAKGNSPYNGAAYGIHVLIDSHTSSSMGNGNKFGIYSSVADTSTNSCAAFFTGRVIHNGVALSTSDERLKENISEMGSVLDRVLKVEPKTFNLRNNPDQVPHFGIIAQQIRNVFPEIVKEVTFPDAIETRIETIDEPYLKATTNPDGTVSYSNDTRKKYVPKETITTSGVYLGVNYIELIPILIKSIQEQQEQIRALEARILELEGK